MTEPLEFMIFFMVVYAFAFAINWFYHQKIPDFQKGMLILGAQSVIMIVGFALGKMFAL